MTGSQALHFGVKYGTNSKENQGIGNFVLPERGSNYEDHNYKFDVRHIVTFSERTVFETLATVTKDDNENIPLSNGVAITQLDAFSGGSSQDLHTTKSRTYELKNLLLYTAGKLTSRSGFEGWYRRDRQVTEDKFVGEFTFSDLQSYQQGFPLQYKVSRGNPLLNTNQLQMGLFSQNDIRITNKFTLFMGWRYEAQTNLQDKVNFDPRLSFAYAVGNSTVIRGGSGWFRLRFDLDDWQ